MRSLPASALTPGHCRSYLKWVYLSPGLILFLILLIWTLHDRPLYLLDPDDAPEKNYPWMDRLFLIFEVSLAIFAVWIFLIVFWFYRDIRPWRRLTREAAVLACKMILANLLLAVGLCVVCAALHEVL